jgi:hypothetical protein
MSRRSTTGAAPTCSRKKYENAAADYERVLRLAPDFPQIRKRLERAHQGAR